MPSQQRGLSQASRERVARTLQQTGQEAWERDDGKVVDPLPVQEVIIEEVFKTVTEDEEFDIWTVVDRGPALDERDTLYENLNRVIREYEHVRDKALGQPEVQEHLEQMAEDFEQ